MAKSESEHSKMATPPLLGTRILDSLPTFISTNLRSKRSRKIWIRCWVAAWASFVLMLPQKSLTAMGNAAFFGILTSLLIPPNAPVQMYLFGITIYIVGECVGWSIGCIAMKIALRVRNQAVTRESLLRVEQMVTSSSANPDAVFDGSLFDGDFLDTRASVIYGVLIAIGAAFFSFARARIPKLFFFSMFGMIFLDAFCTYGPLFPIADYTVVDTIVISASCSMAIGIACCVLIFPETMNHWYLDCVSDLLGALKGYSALHGKILDYNPDEVAQDADGVVTKSATVRSGLLMGVQALGVKSALINVEFSYGRWSGDDAKAVEEPLKVLVSRMTGFDSFPRLMTRYQKERANQVFKTTAGAVTAVTLVDNQTAAANINDIEEIAGDTEIIRQLVSRRRDLEEKYSVRCEDVFVNLRSSTADLRDALTRSIGVVQEMISVVNTCRWRESRHLARFTQAEKNLDDAVDYLRMCLDDYKHDKRYVMLQPFIPLLQSVDDASRDGDALEAEAERRGLPIRSLIIACVYASNLVVSSDAAIELLEHVRETCHKRRKARLWAPSKLRQISHWLVRRDKADTDQVGEEDDPTELEAEEEKKLAPFRMDPDSRPPGNFFQQVMNNFHNFYLWLSSAEGIFVCKYTILTVVMWIPCVFKSSAKFYYEQKGLWALVMAQTTCYMFAADQFFNYAMRMTGTFLGLVVALPTWYIGNGSGNGNPYGLAAIMGVVLVPIAFIRAFLQPMFQIPYLMFTSTLSLAVGYSWIDGHLFVVGSPGIGWEVVWKRFVVVASGCVGSFLVMMLPPTTMSGRKAVRMRHAAVITELSSLYALLMSSWITDFEASEDAVQSPKKKLRGLMPLSTSTFALNEKGINASRNVLPSTQNLSFTNAIQLQKQKTKWIVDFSRRMIALSQQIQALRMQTMMSRWEGNFRGKWPVKEYLSLIEYESNMLAALQQLAGSLDRLDSDWKATLNQRSLILNPDFITDVISTFSLVAQSLRTSEPMHQILPTSLLDRLLFQHTTKTLAALHRPSERTEYVEKVQNPEFMYFATGIASVSLIIGSLDDMHKAAKRLCGEVPFNGFDQWRAEYERSRMGYNNLS